MREDLIGYLLGALDEAEHAALAQRLQTDRRLREQLVRADSELAALAVDRQPFSPPEGLAQAACALVAAHVAACAPSPTPASRAIPTSPAAFSLMDMVVAAGVLLAAALLFFPAIASSRNQARLSACQNNLRELGQGLAQYSRLHSGQFPQVPERGNLAAAGVYAPILFDGGFLNDPRSIICPSSSLASQADCYRPCCLQSLEQADPQSLPRLHATMGGSYGYNLGYREGDRIVGPRDGGRTHFALMADAPRLAPSGGGNSPNHGGQGQNVLFEDLRVKFLTVPQIGGQGDHFFLSERGLVEAGAHRDDAVIGHSAAPPLLWRLAP